ncbi:MAG: hypothetical protein PHF56_23340 [Desulfuromonadaceae bacterium]|nr:hypothetical protein [Desulfuromonadaceae bacterium]
MVAMTLTKEMIEAGSALVRKLDERGIQPNAAFWFYFSDINKWKLVLAEVNLGAEGPKQIYKNIQETIHANKADLVELSLEDITLAKPDAPFVALLRMAIRTGPGISGIRFSNNVINGTVIEDAYIYRII